MKKNVGTVDRAVRVILALGFFSLMAVLHGPSRWAGLAGVIPLVTGFARYCPLYRLVRVNTCGRC